jgi:DNA mismatch repair protein MutS
MNIESATTPMLKQYHTIKSEHPDCILFYRLGDFYEMFYDDAKVASKILDLVLTSRGKGPNGKVPMCGIPYHAAENYIAKLIKAGKKIAICEQIEDPKNAKGIVKRDVVRTITAGTYIDEASADPRYLIALNPQKKSFGIAFTDPANGRIQCAQYNSREAMIHTLVKLPVYECVYPLSEADEIKKIFDDPLVRAHSITMSPYEDWMFNPEIARKNLCDHFATHNLRGFGIEDMPQAMTSAGALLEYLKQMNRQPLRHIDRVSVYSDSETVFISPAARYGLELQSLLHALDNTCCALGKRMFAHWLYHPLKDIASIKKRQHAIGCIKDNIDIFEGLERSLVSLPDIEKHLSRISCGLTSARDLLALRTALIRIPELEILLAPLAEENDLFNISDCTQIRELLERSINPEIPLSKPEGKVIRAGYHEELDALRQIQTNGREYLRRLQEEEIKKTGINSLKIGFNKVFGYYFEITKASIERAPDYFIRKQTLSNAERFITPELKEFEEKMLTAEEKIYRIETLLIADLCKVVLDHATLLHISAHSIAQIDALYSLSVIAASPGYIQPTVDESTRIDITDGRHPVVEALAIEPFVPNDTLLDCEQNHLLIITGPNMAGKSTYIRQTAILVILAQMGSYIPAGSARIGLVDKIFTRIGARDEISKGQSTFMVEMSETAGILNNLTDRSLVVLDEIGRGTSTYDGLSLAWAVSEFVQAKKVRTLFATHFHELTILSEELTGVKNYNVDVKEWHDEVIFLHKIVPGGSDDSYGIYVAKLAGIPREVLRRAQHILNKLEFHNNLKERITGKSDSEMQLTFFPKKETENDPVHQNIIADLDEISIENMTPLDALKKLHEWKEQLTKDE